MSARVAEVAPLKGVSYDPQPGGRVIAPTLVWRVRIYAGGTEKTVGRFATVTEANDAVTAYKAAWDALVVRCDLVGRCVGCQGLRLRHVEDWEDWTTV
jgi:hypothetical protein